MNTRDLGVEIGSKLCHSSLNFSRGVLSLGLGNVLDPPDLHKADGGKNGTEDQKHTDPARDRVAPTAPGGLSHRAFGAPQVWTSLWAQAWGLTESLRRNSRSLTTIPSAAGSG